MPPDEPNDEEKLEKLPEDGDTPAALPTPSRDDPNDQNLTREIRGQKQTKDYPQQDDSSDDFQQLYDEGADVEEPNAGNTVEGYDPKEDERHDKK
jgi:hypothetical protein